ncbi:peptidoglycan-binding domain-containing protein [Streptomyces sp. YU58]|uniref:peptidoglycan-binding domain-containing protein n=1 Tax=Streptomyces sp. SX92 TaxID=3158972 RepID=UPI0027BA3956|nr:peptidoglycan-binding domain-containing protein [Streptomyces coralus]WLW50412.1 peptidoglycan-binding domain-containing protein [Streptomyces coralus]
MALTTTRRRTATVFASLVLLGGTATGGVAVAAETGATAATAYRCDVEMNDKGLLYAGYYSGNTVVPSSSQVTAAGKEAQCLLQYQGHNPGTIDGIFGRTSQAAAKNFQAGVNYACDTNLAEDGKVGPKTWPHLRRLYC